jgi:hypothetical protein
MTSYIAFVHAITSMDRGYALLCVQSVEFFVSFPTRKVDPGESKSTL